MRLVEKETGAEVSIGDFVVLDGKTVQIIAAPKPHKSSASGRVTVVDEERNVSTYYAFCFGLEWIEREDRGWIEPSKRSVKAKEIIQQIIGHELAGRSDLYLKEVARGILLYTVPREQITNGNLEWLLKWLNGEIY